MKKENEGIISKLTKNIPLDTRLRVANEISFITLLTELGYRENKMWTQDEDKTLSKLMKFAKKHTDIIMEEIDKWEKDKNIK